MKPTDLRKMAQLANKRPFVPANPELTYEEIMESCIRDASNGLFSHNIYGVLKEDLIQQLQNNEFKVSTQNQWGAAIPNGTVISWH